MKLVRKRHIEKLTHIDGWEALVNIETEKSAINILLCSYQWSCTDIRDKFCGKSKSNKPQLDTFCSSLNILDIK